MIRPAQSADAQGIRELFHHLSEADVFTRFFRSVRGLSAVEQADAERARRAALAARKTKPEWTPSGAPRTLYGLGASPGLAVGKLVRHVSQRFEITDQLSDRTIDAMVAARHSFAGAAEDPDPFAVEDDPAIVGGFNIEDQGG